MDTRRLAGEHDPDALPQPMRRLHRKIMRAVREERQIKPSDVDETGRTWPGLVESEPEINPQAKGAP